jgi:UDP-N-acetylmuramyl pentapeptide phosphotransferase/UDP-N-acetylglucosamine-1-phosphate transferase
MGGSEILWPTLAAFILSLGLCSGLVLTQRWHGRFSLDGIIGVQKFHRTPVPRVGGVALAAAYALVWPLLPSDLKPIWIAIGLAGLPALGFGLAEDLTKRVSTRARLLATMGSGVLFAFATGYTMDQVDLPGIDWLLSFYVGAVLFTGFSMGGVANAINIIDGFNGLAAGALVIMLAAFAWVGYMVGDALVVRLALVYIGLVAGFFVVNFPFGKLFLGDGGAYFAGFLLASLGVLLPERNVEVSAWAAVLICAYPVIETLASMRRKARRQGYTVGTPDRVHFHMLAYRRYGRRLVRNVKAAHLRNPVTAMLTWSMPLATTGFVTLAYDSVALSASFFFLTVFVYGQLYRVMSLNGALVPLGLARLF